ncbi:CD83 antigen [Struthio camelus]|uniref:CD83 antigen n=1 Tax=Struthio camelus TaxID=8801 RepID=UPI00051E5315|nr:PREDICTED: CD83 antigen isoform X2 [Struthio camelus australis]
MSLIASAWLIILCNVWCLIRGASVAVPDIAVRCAEEVLLPCKVHQDSAVTYQTVSWYKMAGHGEGKAWKVLDVDSHYLEELGGSLELSNDTLFSLRIKNATSHNSGIYKCTLWEPSGERNLSGTVTLKVSGCPGIPEDEKWKKYKAELFMLTCLGIFYLLLIFFTCTCLRKDSMSPNYHKTRKDMKHMLVLISAHEMTTFQDLSSDSMHENQLPSSSV